MAGDSTPDGRDEAFRASSYQRTDCQLVATGGSKVCNLIDTLDICIPIWRFANCDSYPHSPIIHERQTEHFG
jgi:hypothetical protein